MEIKKMEEAKKYLGKKVFQPYEGKIEIYYIGGIHLYYDQVDYEIEGFELYEDKNYKTGYGKVDLDKFQTSFDPKFDWLVYTFSEDLAKQYLIHISRTTEEKEKENDLENAKELLKKHKIKYEIFN
jgi:hypothetical protein